MKTKYDKKVDAKYISIKQGKIAHTKKEQNWLLFDCAKNGDVLGVEILDASKHAISIYTVNEKLFGYSEVASARGSDNESLGLSVKSPEYKKENQFVSA